MKNMLKNRRSKLNWSKLPCFLKIYSPALPRRQPQENIRDTLHKNKIYYIRDAQGNCMSIYSLNHLITPPESPDVLALKLTERTIYGSSRVGTENLNEIIARSDASLLNEFDYVQTVGDKRYELSNHLGNVLQLVTDRKLQIETAIGSGVLDYYSGRRSFRQLRSNK